ncbi:cryptococcal mannosyltransferase 1-domain-containing protein [Fomes fomentarius]|nr:cryptococcal mannosyltransferase 1-domain-containing protein [Fomes fomentarius]
MRNAMFPPTWKLHRNTRSHRCTYQHATAPPKLCNLRYPPAHSLRFTLHPIPQNPAGFRSRRLHSTMLKSIHVLRFLSWCKALLVVARNPPIVPRVIHFLLHFFCIQILLHLLFDGTWRPAFPYSWFAWVALLLTLPTFAATRLMWLLRMSWLSRRSRKGVGRTRDGYVMLDDTERGEEVTVRVLAETHPETLSGLLRTNLLSHWAGQYIIYALILLVAVHECRNFENPADVRFRHALGEALLDPHPRPSGYGRGEKVFIAAAFHQNEAVLPYWTRSMLDVITYLGTNNVFVSILEGYSGDRSPELLEEFARELDRRGVQNRIVVRDTSIPKPGVLEWNPRIEFLAGTRNRVLEPLVASGEYDKVLFSNDVYVEPESVIELLETHDGAFDFACGMDFGNFGAYDMWVLRDRLGRLTAGIWPYFLDAADYEAMRAGDPVPVFTCWNGIVAFRADPLLPVHLRSNNTLSNSPLPNPLPPYHPFRGRSGQRAPALMPPLAFRTSAEGECFSSESFLLPYDFRRVMDLDRIYVNPRVVVGYMWRYYVWYKWILRQRLVEWFVRMYDGAWMQSARMVVGDPKEVWTWDGGDCHPWWPHE